MPLRRQVLTGGILLLIASWAHAQALAPITDPVETPLLPTGILEDDVEMFGLLVYLWQDEAGADVIHFVGDFEMHIGQRRLAAREAVIWMTSHTHERREYHAFAMVLWRDARVMEPGGTVSTGPLLYVTLNSFGKVQVSADKKAFASSADTSVFVEAAKVRSSAAAQVREGPEAGPPVRVLEPGLKAARDEMRVRPAIGYEAKDLTVERIGDRQVIVAMGNVYLFRSAPTSDEFLELRADAAVIYLAQSPEPASQPTTDPAPLDQPVNLTEESAGEGSGMRQALGGVSGPPGEEEGGLGMDVGGSIESVYLEGDIVLTRGERMIRAGRLYYDFINDRAVILDAVFRTVVPEREVPVYIRAEEARQLSAREYRADQAVITTSEFYTPHYHIGASRVDLVDKTQKEMAGLRTGTYTMKHTTFNVGGVPVLYWPFARGELREGETPLRALRIGYSDDFGAEFESKWRLFSLLGFEEPVGFDSTLRLDHFTERGPGVGVDLDYERDDYFGLFRGYYIHDAGEDNLGGRYRDEEPDTENRGRLTWRHRQYLPEDWQLTLEFSYLSDKNFLEEYFESEFDKGKEQETLVYLKKQRDTWAFTLLTQYRINEFLTQTESLPDSSFRLIGQPVGDFATVFSENRAGFVRYRVKDEWSFWDLVNSGAKPEGSGTVGRLDSRQEGQVPLTLGPIKLVPFGMVRGTLWDDSPDRVGYRGHWEDGGQGGVQRGFGLVGVRGSGYLSRVYKDVESKLWDIHGLRHIVKPDFTIWGSTSNVDSQELYPFTESVEEIDEIDGVTMGVRQRWQTKRGGPGRQRTTDVFTLDLEAGAFGDAQPREIQQPGFASYSRPENSISRNYASYAATWRMNDTTSLISESNFDLNDGALDIFNLSYVVERPPRLSYLVAYRWIREIESSLLALGANYKISEKYSLAVREEFDLDRGQTLEFSLGLIRKFPRWYVGLTFDLDEIEDDLGVSMSAWPEGLPQATLGSRRFTGVATDTGIRPE